MEKKYWNPEVLELDNHQFEEDMKVYLQERTMQNLIKFANSLKDARFLVPVEFPKEIDPAVVEKMRKKEKLAPEEVPRMLPILVVNKKGDRFAPIYTGKEELPKDHKYSVIMTVDFSAVLRVARAKNTNTKGILINPSSTRLILNPSLLDIMEKVLQGEDMETVLKAQAAQAGTQKKEIKMTAQQFHVFVRRNVEIGLFPKIAFREKGALMERLSEEGEEAVCKIYKGMYKDQVQFPYEPSDFDVMLLDISDEMSVAAITLPVKNMAPGICQSVYLIWNPQTEEMRYYTIERTKVEDENKLGQVTPDGKYEVIGDAPVQGSELSGIIELVQKSE